VPDQCRGFGSSIIARYPPSEAEPLTLLSNVTLWRLLPSKRVKVYGDVTVTFNQRLVAQEPRHDLSISYRRHRFPPEIIAHAVWLYFRSPLSLCLVEELPLECGIHVSYETVRRWALKSDLNTLAASGARGRAAATSGTSTKS
jgi:hypothetical protein